MSSSNEQPQRQQDETSSKPDAIIWRIQDLAQEFISNSPRNLHLLSGIETDRNEAKGQLNTTDTTSTREERLIELLDKMTMPSTIDPDQAKPVLLICLAAVQDFQRKL